MESKLKCPFCGDELDWCLSCPLPTMSCPNHNCKAYDFLMPRNCWCELIEIKQDFEIAIDTLRYADKCLTGGTVGWKTFIQKALEQIEHKGV